MCATQIQRIKTMKKIYFILTLLFLYTTISNAQDVRTDIGTVKCSPKTIGYVNVTESNGASTTEYWAKFVAKNKVTYYTIITHNDFIAIKRGSKHSIHKSLWAIQNKIKATIRLYYDSNCNVSEFHTLK